MYNILMKIAYLMYSGRKAYDIIPVCRELVKQGDHCFIMVNDDGPRDEVTVAFGNDPRVHISRNQQFAQEGDMSLARGTLLQMKDALDYDKAEFDYFINLTEGMLPTKPRSEIVKFLEENPGDHYYIDHDESTDPSLRKKALKYYPYTNMIVFPKNAWVRGNCKTMASFLNLFGLKRKQSDQFIIGSPWFIFTKETAQVLAEHYPYCSEHFKLSWYAEEMVYYMMIQKYITNHQHDNHDYRVIGPDGSWRPSFGARPVTRELIEAHPEALFCAELFDDVDEELYKEMLKIYNTGDVIKADAPRKKYSEDEFNQLVDKIGEASKKEIK